MAKPEEERFMWLLVFFDLPVKEKSDRRGATKFRKSLIDDGYIMLQYSVYARACKGQDRTEKHKTRLRNRLPEKGNIRLIQITDIQYGRMEHLIGSEREQEKYAMEKLFLF